MTGRPETWADPDPAVARVNARALAERLGSKALAQRRGVLGEPLCLYRIPFSAGDFAFTVRVSGRACVLHAGHRNRGSLPVTFAASFVRPLYGNTHHDAELSDVIGCPVYVPPEEPWRTAARLVLEPAVGDGLRRVDWSSVVQMALYDVQLDAVLAWVDPEHCAAQVRALRDLLLAAFA